MREEGMVEDRFLAGSCPSLGREVQESNRNLALPVCGYGSSERGFQAESFGLAAVLWLVTEIPGI